MYFTEIWLMSKTYWSADNIARAEYNQGICEAAGSLGLKRFISTFCYEKSNANFRYSVRYLAEISQSDKNSSNTSSEVVIGIILLCDISSLAATGLPDFNSDPGKTNVQTRYEGEILMFNLIFKPIFIYMEISRLLCNN